MPPSLSLVTSDTGNVRHKLAFDHKSKCGGLGEYYTLFRYKYLRVPGSKFHDTLRSVRESRAFAFSLLPALDFPKERRLSSRGSPPFDILFHLSLSPAAFPPR
mgnify:CR=1 FL=1